MDVNIPLLRKAVEWAEIEATKPFAESEWFQAAWVLEKGRKAFDVEAQDYEIKCTTAYCIAGWVVAMTLAEDEYQEANGDVRRKGTDEFVSDCEERAAAELGIPLWEDEDANYLFDGGNSIERVREIAEAIAGEKL